MAPQSRRDPTAVPYALGVFTFTSQLRLGAVLATGCALCWIVLRSPAMAQLAPGSAALLVAFLLRPLPGHPGAALSPATSFFSPCLYFETFAIIPLLNCAT